MAGSVIAVLAGTNGAGKSSVGGAMLAGMGIEFFNPDLVAREILEVNENLRIADANSLAWKEEHRQLQLAIELRKDFAFETTLGATTMTTELLRAADQGIEVKIWYVGLSSVELHIERVAARVASGGHDIPEAKIRERYDNSRLNLLKLMPKVAELRVFDNSAESDPASGKRVEPVLLLHVVNGRWVGPDMQALARTPDWAKPLVETALEKHDVTE